jgi:hypothetical protein
MNIKQFSNIISILVLVVVSLLTIGCGGGGGGGGSNPVAPGTDLAPNAVVAPGTSVLANEGSFYSYSSNSEKVAIKLPVNNSNARFALIVTNPNNDSQSVKLMPESFVLGSVRASSISDEPYSSADDFGQRLLNQAGFEQRMRVLASQRRPGVMASQLMRASDHSGENVGDTVYLKVVANTSGSSYLTRECKLMRMSANCKLFVDQQEYDGLSAVVGRNAVTSDDLDHFIAEYETYIHNLVKNSYGPFYDIDNDGRVSILISPVYTKIGFAGLFNSNNFADNSNSNLRDMISVFSPYDVKNWTGERWREATRETIAHEMQHLVNYSANLHFNGVGDMEEEWLDESLSVGIEARYRLMRGSPLMENRFKMWADSPSSVGLLNFNRFLPQYGMVGLFNFFMFEQTDDATIKAMVQSTKRGQANVDELFASRGGLRGIFKDWAMAAMLDSLNKENLVKLSSINANYKYKTPVGLDLNYTLVPYGYSTHELDLRAYGASFYLVEQPAGFSEDEYRFRVESDSGKNIDILMVRLPQP